MDTSRAVARVSSFVAARTKSRTPSSTAFRVGRSSESTPNSAAEKSRTGVDPRNADGLVWALPRPDAQTQECPPPSFPLRLSRDASPSDHGRLAEVGRIPLLRAGVRVQQGTNRDAAMSHARLNSGLVVAT